MAGPRVQALPEEAREEARYAVQSIRDAMREDGSAASSAEYVRSDSLSKILSLACPRLRALVASDGIRQQDGTVVLAVPSPKGPYSLTLGTGKSGTGEIVPSLTVAGPLKDDPRAYLIYARFFADDSRPWCASRASASREAPILEALEVLAPHLPAWDGKLDANGFTLNSAEIEMVRADGGFPGETCREHLETLRRETVLGTLTLASARIPALVGAQEKAGYMWGRTFLAYDDTDKRACGVPIPGMLACFHENIDLIDGNSRWIVGLERGNGNLHGRLHLWAFDRYAGNLYEAVQASISDGPASLGEPHVSLHPATGIATIRTGFDPSTLIGNVLNGLDRDAGVFRNLKKAFKQSCTEARTDFRVFAPDMPFHDEEPDEDAPGLPSP